MSAAVAALFGSFFFLLPLCWLQMELPGETVQMDQLVAVEGENTLRRIGAGPFWEVRTAVSIPLRVNMFAVSGEYLLFFRRVIFLLQVSVFRFMISIGELILVQINVVLFRFGRIMIGFESVCQEGFVRQTAFAREVLVK